MESVICLAKTIFILICSECKWPIICFKIIIFSSPRKTLNFIIQLKLVETEAVSRNVIMCCRGQ